MRKCRFCHDDIEDAATVCPHCGRDLIPGRRTVYPTEPAPTAMTSASSGTSSSTDTNEVGATLAMLASVNSRLTVLIVLGCFVLLGQLERLR
jgi:hypothetical protein